jgi:hypothetical protein
MKYASVPWPVTSPVWGTFALNHGQLTASADFRERFEKRPAASGRSFNGLVNVSLNIPQLDLKLASQDLTSSFGRLNINGQIVIGKKLDLSIGGQFTDIQEAREFAERILNEKFGFPEIRGAGRSTIMITGDYHHPDLSLNFSCSPPDLKDLRYHCPGEVEVKGGLTTGKSMSLTKVSREK